MTQETKPLDSDRALVDDVLSKLGVPSLVSELSCDEEEATHDYEAIVDSAVTLIAQARAAERAAIVAWLRSQEDWRPPYSANNLALRIERGAHLASGASGEEKTK